MPAMEPTRHIWSHTRAIAAWAACFCVALAAAGIAYTNVKPVAAVSTHVFIDTAPPSVVHRAEYPVSSLIQRGELLGRLLTSPPMVDRIARGAGIPAESIGAAAHMTAGVPDAFLEPSSEERAHELMTAGRPYRLEVESRPWEPVLDIYAQAPSVGEATRLADTAVRTLRKRMDEIGDEQGLPAADRLVLRQLAPARGSVVNGGMAASVAFLTFLLVFGVGFAAMRFAASRRGRQVPIDRSTTDAWPFTGRLAPWALAAFMAVVWLVPFSDIQLNIPTPIDLTFDRLILPLVALIWLLGVLLGGAHAPRLRITGVHLAVSAFVICAFLSVILNAAELNQNLELRGAVKQLPLLLAYACVFLIASSVVRRAEVQAFLTYTLVLAVLCALGVLFEYRFKQNLFYIWSDKLLPGLFNVGVRDSTGVDDIGRRVVAGPAMVPLETVAMLAAALPIALVRVIHSDDMRRRAVYGVAACILFAAAFATFRKSALLVPISVLLTIAYFRRRELLRLAPLGLLIVIVVPVLAPGAVGMTTAQFEPDRLGVATVSDRAADYDAVRPDLWTHLLFGKGWGSYNHATYRVLDSEILHRLMEMGVLGLAAFLSMIVLAVFSARAPIVAQDSTWGPAALMCASGAVSFGVASTLFDVMSFPHAVYVFLMIAGLNGAVVVHYRDDVRRRAPRPTLSQAGEDQRVIVPVERVAPVGASSSP